MYQFEPYKHNNQLDFDLCFHSCGFESCLPDHRVGPHIPDFYIFHFVIDGYGTYETKDNIFHLQKGDGFLLHPGNICYYTPDSKNPWTYYWIGFNGTASISLLKSICSYNDPTFKHNSEVISIVKRIHQLSKQEISIDLKSIKFISYLYSLFYQLSLDSKHVTDSSSKHKHYIDYALSYISQNYHKHLTVEEIANYVHIDRTYLYSLFKKEYNISPQQYIINYRIEKATYLLKHTTITSKEISNCVGYNDYSLFCRMFKKKKGMAPSEFRHSHT